MGIGGGGAVSLFVICFCTCLLLSLLNGANHRTGQHLRLYVGQGCKWRRRELSRGLVGGDGRADLIDLRADCSHLITRGVSFLISPSFYKRPVSKGSVRQKRGDLSLPLSSLFLLSSDLIHSFCFMQGSNGFPGFNGANGEKGTRVSHKASHSTAGW